MTVLIVDDHPIIQAILKDIISSQYPDYEVYCHSNIDKAIAACKSIKPNLLILDVSIGDRDIIDYFPSIKLELPEAYFIIYSMHNIPGYIKFFEQAGAHAYVLKEEAPERMKEVIDGIQCGKTFFCKEETKSLSAYELNQLKFSLNEKTFLRALIKTGGYENFDTHIEMSSGEIMSLRKKVILKSGARNTQDLIRLAKLYKWVE